MDEVRAPVVEVKKRNKRVAQSEASRPIEHAPASQFTFHASQPLPPVNKHILRPADLLALQRTVGNRHVQRVVTSWSESRNGRQGILSRQASQELLAGQSVLQRSPGNGDKVTYPVKVPKGIKTEEELDRYAEVLIFGKVMNFKWSVRNLDVERLAEEGKSIRYIYEAELAAEHGAKKPGESPKPLASNPAYKQTKGKEREATTAEIDRRYWEGTGIAKGTQIEEGQQANVDMWNVYRDQVMNDKKKLAELPAQLKELMGGEPSFAPQDYQQLLQIAGKLKQFSVEDIAVYKMLSLRATDNLDLFEKSVDMFLARKEELKKAFEQYQKAQKSQASDTMQGAIDSSWQGVDISKIDKLSEAEKYDLARQQTWEVTKAQLEYMKNHPGEVAVDFAKTATLMNTGETFSAIGKDITEAASGDANAWARWAGGTGAGAKLSGWLLAVGGVLYVLSWLTGIGELATIAAFMGAMLASTIVLSTAESELRIKAASQAKTPEEFKEQVTKAATARTNTLIMVGMVALGLAIRFVAKTFFPKTVASVSNALARFREKVRIVGKLSDIKAEFAAEMGKHRKQLIDAGETAKKDARTQAEAVDKLTLDEFIEKMETGKGDFFQEAAVQEGQKISWKELAKTPEGLRAIEAYKAQLADALRNAVPKEIDGIVKEQTDAIDAMLAKTEKATVPAEFEQAIKEHEAFLSEAEVAKRGKAREEQMRKEKAEEAYQEIVRTIRQALIERVKSRIKAQSDKFELTYKEAEVQSIIAKGEELGLSNRTIEDVIYTGSRKAKAITADELIQQMETWVNVVKKRGYPYRFADLAEFQKFGKQLLDGLRAAGIPADDVRIQGSALRKSGANDVDIAVFVDEANFNRLLVNRFDGKITLSGSTSKLSLKTKTAAELVQLADDIVVNPRNYNAQARTYANAMKNGIISSKSDISNPLKNVAKEIQKDYPQLNIEAVSILQKGGAFELLPDMPVKGK